MLIENNVIFFPSIRSKKPEIIDKAFAENLNFIHSHPEIEGFSLEYTGLEERHLEKLVENLENHENIKYLGLATNFRNEPHPNLMNLISQFIKDHPKINTIDLERCNLQDEDIEKLFTQLTKKEIKSIFFRISRNSDLTLKTAKLVLDSNGNVGTIKCLSSNANIYNSKSPEYEHIKFLRKQSYNHISNDSQTHWISTSEEDSEKGDKSPSNNSINSYSLRSKK